MDAAGNVYWPTYSDGAYGYRSVFKVTRQRDGTWVLTDLYDFTGFDDGRWPIGSVVVDPSGNLWGRPPVDEIALTALTSAVA